MNLNGGLSGGFMGRGKEIILRGEEDQNMKTA
jgi:hypothetical protein